MAPPTPTPRKTFDLVQALTLLGMALRILSTSASAEKKKKPGLQDRVQVGGHVVRKERERKRRNSAKTAAWVFFCSPGCAPPSNQGSWADHQAALSA